jgi:hypothetical protein
MSDRAALLIDFADNTIGAITAADMRDFVNSDVLPQDLTAGTNITIDKSSLPAVTISAASSTRNITFGLAGPVILGNDLTNHVYTSQAATIVGLSAIAKIAVTGNLVIRVNKNGTPIQTSLLTLLNNTAVINSTTFSVTAVSAGDYFSIDVTAVGTARDVNVTLVLRY